jgi:Protein of unknown function (DUF664)
MVSAFEGYRFAMDESAMLIDAFGRIRDLVRRAVGGLTAEQLRWAPAPGANSVGWLIWHLARVQDHHIADILGDAQVWESGDWAGQFGRPPDPRDTGYGHSADQVAAVRPRDREALTGYYDAVAHRTRKVLDEVMPADLDRIVDESWDPPVTLGVRLNSVLSDNLQHAGQAAYVRGLLR